MELLLVGAVAVCSVPALAALRARREFEADGRLSDSTFVALLAAFVILTGCILLAAWWHTWALPWSPTASRVGGTVLAATGASFYAAARLQFRSFRLTWGLTLDRLVTTGVYRFSRNPQTVGASGFLLGVAVWGRSSVALLLVLGYSTGCAVWSRLEEHVLERRYGDTYRRYCDQVPRFIGVGRRSG